MESNISKFDLQVRYQIYRHFADHCTAPSYQQIADMLDADHESVRQTYHRLHANHMIFLEPNGDSVRMANPFSTIPTSYKVVSGDKAWWANCAWDTMGIAVVLGIDVIIEAEYPDSQDRVTLRVENGIAHGKNHMVYFPLPCAYWYDDLIYT